VRVTKDPSTHLFYVLETLPGVKIRQLLTSADRQAAKSYLASLLRYQNNVSSKQEDYKRELLGDGYDPSYRHTLRFIEPSNLSQFSPLPIGEGSFGKVYRCFWGEKPDISGEIGAVEQGLVALKLPIERKEEGNKMNAKFFHEVGDFNAMYI
jgi:hypothetical protein